MQRENQSGTGGQGGTGAGRRRGSGRGPGGFCVCPKCGEKMKHQMGQPCPDQECPKCGTRMIRE
jgi:hypothetical protein